MFLASPVELIWNSTLRNARVRCFMDNRGSNLPQSHIRTHHKRVVQLTQAPSVNVLRKPSWRRPYKDPVEMAPDFLVPSGIGLG
jgi:hypothetical protein